MENIIEWRPVVRFEGVYEVSSCGIVRSLDRIVSSPKREDQKLKGRILRSGVGSTGYLYVALCVNGKPKTHTVHELVAAAYIGLRPDRAVIDHVDGNRKNNLVSNLRYVSQTVNMRNITKVNSRSGALGVYPNGNGWMAQVRIGDKTKHLGTYRTIEEAAAARDRFEVETDHRQLASAA